MAKPIYRIFYSGGDYEAWRYDGIATARVSENRSGDFADIYEDILRDMGMANIDVIDLDDDGDRRDPDIKDFTGDRGWARPEAPSDLHRLRERLRDVTNLIREADEALAKIDRSS